MSLLCQLFPIWSFSDTPPFWPKTFFFLFFFKSSLSVCPTQYLAHSVFVPLSFIPIKLKSEHFDAFFNPLPPSLFADFSLSKYLFGVKVPFRYGLATLFITKNSDKINAFFGTWQNFASVLFLWLITKFCLMPNVFLGWWQNCVLCQTLSLANDKILSYAKLLL